MIRTSAELPRAQWLILPVLLAMLASVARAQPRLSVVGGEQIQYGRIGPTVLKRAVQLVNVGSDTLHITSIMPSCGCTTAPIDRSALAPGDTATISVSITMTEAAGEQVKSLQINSDDKGRSGVVVTIAALVVRDLAAAPKSIDLPSGARIGKEYPFTAEIQNLSERPITIKPPKLSSQDDATAQFTMASSYRLGPKESLKLSGSLVPRRSGAIAAEVVIETSSELMPRVAIPINGIIGIAALTNIAGPTDTGGDR